MTNEHWLEYIIHISFRVLRHNIHGRFVGISGKYSRVFSVLRLNDHFILGWVWGGAKVLIFFTFSRYAEKIMENAEKYWGLTNQTDPEFQIFVHFKT